MGRFDLLIFITKLIIPFCAATGVASHIETYRSICNEGNNVIYGPLSYL